jgi:glycolate oxidase FAD binding subunit
MAAVLRILHSPLSPTALELVSGTAAASLAQVSSYQPSGAGGVLLVAEVDGFAKGVARQLRDVETYVREAGAADAIALGEEEARALWADLREAGTRLEPAPSGRGESGGGGPAIALKVAVPVAAVAAVVGAVESTRHEERWGPAVVSHAGSGIIHVCADEMGRDGQDAVATIARLRAAAVGYGGSLVVERCPPALKGTLDVWGDVGPALAVMRRLKATFDPRGILNPGRFVGGI